MALLTRTYTFTDGTTAYGSQVDSEIANIVNTLNNLDSGSNTWTNVKVTTLLPQADVSLGGHKVTNLGTPTTSGDAIAYPVTASVISANTITNAQILSQTIRGSTANSSATAREISQGTISTVDLRANAVTSTQSSTSGASSQNTAVTSVTITTIGGPVLLLASFSLFANAAASIIKFTLDITRGATSITGAHAEFAVQDGGGIGTSGQRGNASIMVIDSQVSGTYTYNLTYNLLNGTNPSIIAYSLQAIELRA